MNGSRHGDPSKRGAEWLFEYAAALDRKRQKAVSFHDPTLPLQIHVARCAAEQLKLLPDAERMPASQARGVFLLVEEAVKLAVSEKSGTETLSSWLIVQAIVARIVQLGHLARERERTLKLHR